MTTVMDPEAAADNLFDQYFIVSEHSISTVSQKDSYVSYCRESVNLRFEDIFQYWQLQKANYPDLAKMAYDMHSILAISAECKRIFSSTKLLISDLQGQMGDDIIEASECLKSWSKLKFCMY